MRNTLNSVDIQGMGNTIDLNKVMNLYTSSFTEGFLQVLENYNPPSQKIEVIENEVKPLTLRKSKSKPKNTGFEKLKNPLLKDKLQNCKSVNYNPEKHIRIKELGYKSIHEMDKGSKKKWEQYFSKGKVNLDKGVTTSRISPKILFDKSIGSFFKKKDTSK